LKYVIYGAFSSGIMLFGLSIVFGLAGSTKFFAIQEAMWNLEGSANFAFTLASIFILAGFGYKISAVPFHFWTPDVYEGAPTPITAFLSVAPKAAGFALLIRFFHTTFMGNGYVPLDGIDWPLLIALLSAVTMTVGNLMAIQQDNVKRMLAFSSIAHAGYMLMAFSILSEKAVLAIMLYLTMYFFMNLGAFITVIYAENKLNAHTMDEWRGFGKKAPLLGVLMTILLMSLTGLPPTAGFVGKTASSAIFLMVFEIVVGLVAVGLYDISIIGIGWLALTMTLIAVGLALLGTLTAGIVNSSSAGTALSPSSSPRSRCRCCSERPSRTTGCRGDTVSFPGCW